MHPLRAALVSLLTASTLLVAVESAASTPTATSSPERSRCTIVGTEKSDRLRGTPGRDVICGRGGDDRIDGRGGGDVLLGGPGRDRLSGDGGADRLVGGAGNDVLDGDAGDDRLDGGSGADRLDGAAGDDRVVGGAMRDLARGGTGEDDVSGGSGDDVLDGGPQADELDGGAGFNTCTLDAEDVGQRCSYDEEAGVAHEITFSAAGVDVTSAPDELTVRVRASDDTRVEDVIVTAGDETSPFPGVALNLVSGTRRHGWWEGTLQFPRYAPPGTYVPHVRVIDRIGRYGDIVFTEQAFEVRDDDPDLEQPTVSLLAPLPTLTLDVRSRAQQVTARARIVDAKSGVKSVAFYLFEPLRPSGDFRYSGGGAPKLVDGTRRDGVWQVDFEIPKGGLGGDWNIAVAVTDRAHGDDLPRATYWGPDGPDYQWGIRGDHRSLPDGRGSFAVIGTTVSDAVAPELSGATVSPSTVDTLTGPATVQVTVAASDNVRVEGVGGKLCPVGEQPNSIRCMHADLRLVQGTRRDGIWSGPAVLPQGTPPGQYRLWLDTRDANLNGDLWLGVPESTWGARLLDTDPIVTVVDSRAD